MSCKLVAKRSEQEPSHTRNENFGRNTPIFGQIPNRDRPGLTQFSHTIQPASLPTVSSMFRHTLRVQIAGRCQALALHFLFVGFCGTILTGSQCDCPANTGRHVLGTNTNPVYERFVRCFRGRGQPPSVQGDAAVRGVSAIRCGRARAHKPKQNIQACDGHAPRAGVNRGRKGGRFNVVHTNVCFLVKGVLLVHTNRTSNETLQ
jgi:hypothetical protein